jgi:hypothetical protein
MPGATVTARTDPTAGATRFPGVPQAAVPGVQLELITVHDWYPYVGSTAPHVATKLKVSWIVPLPGFVICHLVVSKDPAKVQVARSPTLLVVTYFEIGTGLEHVFAPPIANAPRKIATSDHFQRAFRTPYFINDPLLLERGRMNRLNAIDSPA